MASSVMPARTCARVSRRASPASMAALRIAATSPSSFAARSRSTRSVVAVQPHALPAWARRSASWTESTCASYPTRSSGPSVASSLKNRSQTLVPSTSMRATAPASARACSSYRKSVTSRTSPRVTATIAAEPLKPVRYRMLAGDATSNPSSPSATSAAASASCRARRGSAIMAGSEIADQALESQPIALRTEPRHHADRDVRQHRAAALRFSPEDVRQVHLNERHTHGDESVAHGEAGVRERRRIDDGAVRPPLQRLDRVHQLALVVRLRPADLDAERSRALARARFDLSQRGSAVQLRFALAQQVEVGAVQHGDVH